MSLDYTSYQSTTPPGMRLQDLRGTGHSSRNIPNSSIPYPNEASISVTSPSIYPRQHHHGPAILPRQGPQDVVLEPVPVPGPLRRHRVLSNTRNPPGFVPYPYSRPSVRRSVIEANCSLNPLISPVSTPTSTLGAARWSALSSPVSAISPTKRKASGDHPRSVSVPVVDGQILRRYGYPTHRKFLDCIPQAQRSPGKTTDAAAKVPYQSSVGLRQSVQIPSPTQTASVVSASPYSPSHALGAQISPGTPVTPVTPATTVDHDEETLLSSTTLLSYLTAPTQVMNLVRNVSVVPVRGLHDYFWWDIRNVRSWESFSLSTFDNVSGLAKLLKTAIPPLLTPPATVPVSRLSPESEKSLVSLIHDVFSPRINAALAVSQGPDHLMLYRAPEVRATANKNCGAPHFLANYVSDRECTSSGQRRSRLVGVAKSFHRWNTGMRNENPNRRVEYLNGLAHLHKAMREHSCRYGFIVTEIELVCVRAGCEQENDMPYFGYLELSAPVPTRLFSRTSGNPVTTSSESEEPRPRQRLVPSSSPVVGPGHRHRQSDDKSDGLQAVPMTASLALYFLLMLSKSEPLPSQPSGRLEVGGPGALTRQRVLPDGKDEWIPQPQIGERRDAKRARGWIWPQDAWHRKEGGGVSHRTKRPAGGCCDVDAGEAKRRKKHK